MESQEKSDRDTHPVLSASMYDWLAIGFRHRRLMALSFLGILLGAVLAAVVLPQHYQARTKILVKRERLDPLVTADARSPLPQVPSSETEMELYSEVELLKSRDLLEKVVLTCGLQRPEHRSGWGSLFNAPSSAASQSQEAISEAVRRLEKDLKVELLPKTSLIALSYESTSPEQAYRVLTTVVSLYLDKHLAVRRSPGAFEFFQQQTKQYQQALADAEARLMGFSRQEGGISPQQEKEITLQKVMEFDAILKQTRAAKAETEQRVRTLEAQATSLPSRMVTQVRTSDNPQLLQNLKSTLLSLELKRTELLTKFEPGYRLVQEVDQQIAQTRAAITSAEKSLLREETTDRDPTYEWVREGLAKAKSELSALQARSEAMSRAVQTYQEKARALDQKEVVQQALLRDVKAEEENYLLYRHKQEEARISDALDRGRIINVAVAEPAAPPVMPTHSRGLTALLGFLLATLVSLGSAVIAEHLDPALRSADEVKEFLEVPVIASIASDSR